jgi:FixJ family two-component response regulator
LSPLISIVEDDASLRASLLGLLRSFRYRSTGFESAEAFLAAGAAAESACVVTDIHLPGLSGIDLKRRLDDDDCATPVIMITARSEPELHERAAASGAICVLKKPFGADALIKCIERALGR